jgi:hypothetical protein
MERKSSNQQIRIPFQNTEQSVRLRLEAATGRPVSLVLTDNSTSMLSVKLKDGVLHVRIHRMFLDADDDIMDEIAHFIKRKNRGLPLFRKFIRDNSSLLNRKPPKRTRVRTSGNIHDLKAIYAGLNDEYFGGALDAVITWGAGRPRFAVRKRTLGSYSARANVIRINPALDSRKVPRYFIAFVVYHEMLHAAIGIQNRSGRRSIHPAEFRRRERLFRDYEKATAWERKSYC